MSDDNKTDEIKPKDESIDTNTKPVDSIVTKNDSDEDINKLISEIEKDMELKKEQLFTETKQKFDKEYGTKFADKDKEISALKEKISSIESSYKESTKKIIDEYKEEMKNKFDLIEKELSNRQSAVPNQSNPFRQKDEKIDGDWYKRKDLSDEEKYRLFEKYTLGK